MAVTTAGVEGGDPGAEVDAGVVSDIKGREGFEATEGGNEGELALV